MEKTTFLEELRLDYVDVFDNKVMAKGSRILNLGLVMSIKIHEEGVWALVGSERDKDLAYEVSISRADGGYINYICECPVAYECKHCAAVLIGLLNRSKLLEDSGVPRPKYDGYKTQAKPRESSLQQLIKGAPSESPFAKKETEQRSPFIIEARPSNILKFPSPKKASYPKFTQALDVGKWRIAYAIHRHDTGYSASDKKFSVSRVLCGIRQDGKLGRLKKWTPSYATALVSPDAARLESVLNDTSTQSISLSLAGSLLVELNESPLFITETTEPTKGIQATLHKATKAQLGFEPQSLSSDRVSVLYTVRLAFFEGSANTTNTGSPARKGALLGPPVTWACATLGPVIYCAQSHLYFANGGTFAGEEIINLLELRKLYEKTIDHRDLGPFIAATKALNIRGLSIAAPPERIEIVRRRPEVEVVLKEVGYDKPFRLGCLCTFRFLYDGIEREYQSKGLLLHRHGKLLELVDGDPAFEKAVVSFFAQKLGDSVQRIENIPNPSLAIDLRLSQFFLEYFTYFSEQGYRFAISTSLNKLNKIAPGKVVASVSTGINWFNAELRLDVDGRGISLDNSVVFLGGNLIGMGKQLAYVDSALLPVLQRFQKYWNKKDKNYKIDGRDLSSLYELYELLDDDQDNEDNEELDEKAELFRSITGLGPLREEKLPSAFSAKLRPYQKHGYDWISRLLDARLGALLADDMGLGKTLQALALLVRLKEKGELSSALVVAPVTVLGNWVNEIKRFAPSLSYYMHHGNERARKQTELDAEIARHDLILTSYQTLRLDIDLLSSQSFSLSILDEAQAIKNPRASVSVAIRDIQSERRLILTGTPVENRPLDLWSHFSFLNPGLLGTVQEFVADYERPIAAGEEIATELLRKRCAPFILRRRKEEVLDDLPPKEEIIRWVELSGKQRGFYEALRKECADTVGRIVNEAGFEHSAFQVLEALLRLRQAAIHPGLISKDHLGMESAKLEELYTLLGNLRDEGHKVLVFSQFVGVLQFVRQHLDTQGFNYEYLDGKTRNRTERIKHFEKDASITAFLLSLKAGGVGINLVAADYVIILDPWWNPAVESQAVDRAHRIGQARKVTVYRLVSRGTIEEKILLLQDRKRTLVENLIAESGKGLAGFSKEEILALFE
ncbi:hypothetical protein MASR2M78_34690 [Treponema sp.]